MTIFIFGDSFSCRYDDCYYDGEIDDLWYDIVMREMRENVVNTSEGGKGPYSSFKFFYEHVEQNNIKEGDKIIFMLSSQYRLPFKFLDDKDLGYDYIDYFLNNELIFPKEIELYIENFSYDIISTYDTLKEEIDRANIKNLYFLKTFSNLKKIKTICFRCFEYKKYDHYELSSLNDDYFNLNSNILWNVSLCENELRHNSDTMNNQRANHLSYCNHKILSNIILNFFSNRSLLEEFHKNIFKKQKSKEQFIYE